VLGARFGGADINRATLVHKEHFGFGIVELAVDVKALDYAVENHGEMVPLTGLRWTAPKAEVGEPPMAHGAKLGLRAVAELGGGGVRPAASGPTEEALAFGDLGVVDPGGDGEAAIAGEGARGWERRGEEFLAGEAHGFASGRQIDSGLGVAAGERAAEGAVVGPGGDGGAELKVGDIEVDDGSNGRGLGIAAAADLTLDSRRCTLHCLPGASLTAR